MSIKEHPLQKHFNGAGNPVSNTNPLAALIFLLMQFFNPNSPLNAAPNPRKDTEKVPETEDPQRPEEPTDLKISMQNTLGFLEKYGKKSSPSPAMQEEARKLLSEFYPDTPDLTAAARGLAAWNEAINAAEPGASKESEDLSEQKQKLRENFHTAIRYAPATVASMLEELNDPGKNADQRSTMMDLARMGLGNGLGIGSVSSHAGLVLWTATTYADMPAPEVEYGAPARQIMEQAKQILADNDIYDPDGRLAEGLVRYARQGAYIENNFFRNSLPSVIGPATAPDGSPMPAQTPR